MVVVLSAKMTGRMVPRLFFDRDGSVVTVFVRDIAWYANGRRAVIDDRLADGTRWEELSGYLIRGRGMCVEVEDLGFVGVSDVPHFKLLRRSATGCSFAELIR